LFAFVSLKMIPKIFIFIELREKREKKRVEQGVVAYVRIPDSGLWSAKLNSADHFYCASVEGYIMQSLRWGIHFRQAWAGLPVERFGKLAIDRDGRGFIFSGPATPVDD
jgi:hypothetical protein